LASEGPGAKMRTRSGAAFVLDEWTFVIAGF